MNTRKYLVIAAIILFGSVGDVALSRGMKEVGKITLSNWHTLFTCMTNPWVIAGTILLIGFMVMYMAALSWADLTYVLPAGAVGYIVTAFLAEWLLHEVVTPKRWLGILLITAGVGFVAGGPSVTPATLRAEEVPEEAEVSS